MHSSKSPETPWKWFFELIKNTKRKKYQRGPTPWPGGGGRALPPGHATLPRGPPSSPPVTIFCYMKSFTLEKIHKQAFGTKHRRHEPEPWRNQSRAPVELFCRGNFPPEGGKHCNHRQQRSSHREGVNLHQHLHQHHILSTLVHLLYPIFVSKPQIGTCGLLVVLITPCSWC